MDDGKFRDPRGELKDDDATIALIDNPDSTEEIPTLDFAPYLEGKPGGREEVAAKLREITMTVGFFYLKNHGIPQNLIDGAFAQSRRFHELPDAEKDKLAYKDEAGFGTGYRGMGKKWEYSSNTSIVTKTKPSLYSQYSVRREPDAARAGNPSSHPGTASISGRTNCPASAKTCWHITPRSKSWRESSSRYGAYPSICRSIISTAGSRTPTSNSGCCIIRRRPKSEIGNMGSTLIPITP